MPRAKLIYDMTAKQYKAEREKRGTQAEVAKLLKLARPTISHRERGAQPITVEAAIAIQSLPEKPNPALPQGKAKRTKRL